jgi:Fic family protein
MKKPEPPPKHTYSVIKSNTINYLLNSGKFQELYKLERENYLYWEELKYRVKKWQAPPEEIWRFLKNQRMFSRSRFEFSKLSGFTFLISIPGFIQKYLHEFDMHLGGILEGQAMIPPEDKNRYLISSIMEEAIASSQLEGAVTTRKIAREMLEQNRKPKNKSEQMILNNYHAMKWIVRNKNITLTPERLLEIHLMITSTTLDEKEDEGKFRDNDNVKIMDENNEIFYTPPPYLLIKRLIEEFCDYANDKEVEGEFVHPIIKGIILHFLIGYIHPFIDGNGRTARTIFYWYLIKKGYWLTEYMSISRIILKAKSQYARAYLHTEYDENDLTYFIIYNIKALNVALKDLKKYIHKKTLEKRRMLSLLKETSFNERQIVVLKDILNDRNKFFTVKQIELRFNISNQTARNDLTGLAKRGVLVEKQSGRKSQFFPSEDFDKILNIG